MLRVEAEAHSIVRFRDSKHTASRLGNETRWVHTEYARCAALLQSSKIAFTQTWMHTVWKHYNSRVSVRQQLHIDGLHSHLLRLRQGTEDCNTDRQNCNQR